MSSEPQPVQTENQASSDNESNLQLEQVIADLESGSTEEIAATLESAHPADVANLLEALPLNL